MLVRSLAVVAAALLFAGSAQAYRASFGGVAFAAFTIAPGNMDCVQVDDDVVGWTGDCDPIDVLFPGQTMQTVLARLHAAGWVDTTGSTEWLYYGDSTLVPVQAQLAVPDGTDPTMRYHVRLWQVGAHLVVGAVHHEHGSPHKIDMAWDAAEAFLAQGLCATWCGHVMLPMQLWIQQGSPMWRGFGNDGMATVIRRAPRAHVSGAGT
ncbi:MAG TPA: hypothetical protein VKR23_03245 [Gaiellaceae bacterium]|nr:hypothetical protein [Gaiellaceae bacterium]